MNYIFKYNFDKDFKNIELPNIFIDSDDNLNNILTIDISDDKLTKLFVDIYNLTKNVYIKEQTQTQSCYYLTDDYEKYINHTFEESFSSDYDTSNEDLPDSEKLKSMFEKMKINTDNFKFNRVMKSMKEFKSKNFLSKTIIPENIYPTCDEEAFYAWYILNDKIPEHYEVCYCKTRDVYFDLFNIYHSNCRLKDEYKLLVKHKSKFKLMAKYLLR